MMFKKFLVLLAWLIGVIILTLGCWLIGISQGWPLWKSVALLAGVIAGLWLLSWLYRRFKAWQLRRRLSRPVQGNTFTAKRLDLDWRAGLDALKRSRLSRFGSPLYVLPWYLALGPEADRTADLLQRCTGTDPVQGHGEDPPVLQWWLQRQCVVLSATTVINESQAAPGTAGAYWHRLLYWMAHTRRREPLNGLILTFSVDWLNTSDDAQLNITGQRLRKQLDDLTRVYNARIPVYIVLTDCQTLPGFIPWAHNLGDDLNRQAMGYINKAPNATVGQFIADALNSVVHRMFDLRVAQGITAIPDHEAFGLPERMTPLANRLGAVLRPAFQANPYSETPILRALYLTGQPSDVPQDQVVWFGEGLFNQALPGQRDAWQPLERWRHWRRFLRHAAVLTWLLLCVAIGGLLVYSSRVADTQLQAANTPDLAMRPDFSGPIGSDLHSLQALRQSIHTLQSQTQWAQQWLPFHHRVTEVRQTMMNTYTREFYRQVIEADLHPLLTSASKPHNDRLLAAWAQMLVRRINLLDAALDGENVYAEPAPGSEMPLIYTQTNAARPDGYDSLLLGNMYQDYLTWQTNHGVLSSERQTLQQALANLDLGERPISWIYAWVGLQGTVQPVRLTDFWNIAAHPQQPYVPAAYTPAGVKAVAGFAQELSDATRNSALWKQRHAEFEAQYMQAGLNAWYEFADAFTSASDQLSDGSVRRGVLSMLFTPNDPYRQLIHQLATIGASVSTISRPPWMQQAIRLDGLLALAQRDDGPTKTIGATLKQHVDVVQRFGGELLHGVPGQQDAVASGLSQLGTDQRGVSLLNTYRKGVLDTIIPLQQGQGNAMKAATEIWSFGHDPNVKSAPLIDADKALNDLRRQTANADDPRADVVWKLMAGPMNFTLDYTSRNVACTLQNQWDSGVLSTIQGVDNPDLANQLLFGDRGQVGAFLKADIKNFIDQNGNRYIGRSALGREIPLNGQFYAFASMTQLHQVTLQDATLRSKQDQGEIQALTQQQTELDKQIAQLEATTATVTLSTVPPQTNSGAKLLPESVTLTLQCANKRLTLENLNFPNQTVFPWSLANCGDTTLRIRFADFTLTRLWSGARGFIDFLREFSSGQRRYTADEFSDQATALQQAGIQWLVVSYREQGQDALIKAFADADKLHAQSNEVQARLAQLQPGSAPGSTPPSPPPPPVIPPRIISTCMGPANYLASNTPASSSIARATASVARAKPTTTPGMTPQAAPTIGPSAQRLTSAAHHYVVQVGIFADPDRVRAALTSRGYAVHESTITLSGHSYQRVRVSGYATEQSAQQAADDIGRLLKLKPEVLREPAG